MKLFSKILALFLAIYLAFGALESLETIFIISISLSIVWFVFFRRRFH